MFIVFHMFPFFQSVQPKLYQTRSRRSYVEDIARNILPSSLRSGCPFRNIYFSNVNGSFSALRRCFCFPLWPMIILPDLTVSSKCGFLIGNRNFLHFGSTRGHPTPSQWGPYCSSFQFSVLLSSFCVLCPMLLVSLGCSFLIAFSVFANVCLLNTYCLSKLLMDDICIEYALNFIISCYGLHLLT